MNEGQESTEDTATEPGDWERKPSQPEDRRYDDGSEPLAEPSEDAEDDLAEREAGDVRSGDKGYDEPDPPDDEGLEETGTALERHGEPLLTGGDVPTPVGAVPSQSLLAMGAFVGVFCVVFFGLWALLGNLGIFLGILAGGAAGLAAMKMLADRER